VAHEDTILGFLLYVLADPARMRQYHEGKLDELFHGYTLTKEQQDVVRSRDPDRLRRAIEQELGVSPEQETMQAHITIAPPG
jgi:hypothetical protein